MSFEVLLLLVLIGGFMGLFLAMRKMVHAQKTSELESVVDRVFGMSAKKVAEQSQQLLQGERETIKTDLENKQKMIEKLVSDLQRELEKRQDEIRELERDRTKSFSKLVTQIDEQRQITEKLQVSTENLSKVLSNNQSRGAWGERIIEDLLKSNGLIEGVHFLLQSQLSGTALRPDVLLLLPNKKVVAVDVKFPYSEVQKMADATSNALRESHKKQFASDLKIKINKVAEYIDPQNDTLDYAIMFVPNETLFTYINSQFPDLIDSALRQRVLMVSPFSFLIVARTVMESYRNFLIGDKLKDVIKEINGFVSEWSKFKEKFEKYGRSIDTLQNDYQSLMSTRVRQMEKRIDKVQELGSGSLVDVEDEGTLLS
ncbi:MAG: DNA recombination protein RmuC [Microgenomates group bacterium]